MTKIDIKDKIKVILIAVLKHDNFVIDDTLTAKDVEGWDSLSHMIIITEIEKAFDIRFKLKELNKMNNIGDLVDLIQVKIEQK